MDSDPSSQLFFLFIFCLKPTLRRFQNLDAIQIIENWLNYKIYVRIAHPHRDFDYCELSKKIAFISWVKQIGMFQGDDEKIVENGEVNYTILVFWLNIFRGLWIVPSKQIW